MSGPSKADPRAATAFGRQALDWLVARLGGGFFAAALVLPAVVTAGVAIDSRFSTVAAVAAGVGALVRPRWALPALAVVFLLRGINWAVADPLDNLPYYAVILSVAASRLRWPVWAGARVHFLLMAFVAGAFWSGVLGPMPDLSLPRLVLFVIGLAAMSATYRGVGDSEDVIWWLTCFTVGVSLASIPLMFTPTGSVVNGDFQGISGQPQLMGILLAPGLAVLIIRWFDQRDRLLLPFIALLAVQIALSAARIAVIAVVAGLVVVFLLGTSKRLGRPPPFLVRGVLAAFLAAAFLVAFVQGVPGIGRGGVADILLKDRPNVSLAGQLITSRGPNIESSVENWLSSPILGLGMGLPAAEIDTVPLPGLEISFPITREKGFGLTGVLEETGVVGLLLLGATLGVAVLATREVPFVMAGVATAIAVNIAEVVVFSFGLGGLWIWLFVYGGFSQVGHSP